ncbi:DUF4352 domain-containing protein [Austwickia sp. TVS 96-490-7B]|uniref:DUF4352 domain-containing protein n=1 Tax=Austwickia sp. TVS 96-490-7B TaxID=2830843 RepID=UPI001C57DB19|nr:DUF4352 domain-containing protein [Austwickia sp. TVS 96-490-7B]
MPVTEKSSADDAVYSDKVTIAIEKMTRSKASGQGPGVMSGAPLLSVQVVVRNSSSKPLDLSAVVVSLRYGSPERIAPGSYDAASVDFSGKLQPGAHATATYTFVVPADAGDKVRVVVDIDGSHQPAVFRGMRRS